MESEFDILEVTSEITITRGRITGVEGNGYSQILRQVESLAKERGLSVTLADRGDIEKTLIQLRCEGVDNSKRIVIFDASKGSYPVVADQQEERNLQQEDRDLSRTLRRIVTSIHGPHMPSPPAFVVGCRPEGDKYLEFSSTVLIGATVDLVSGSSVDISIRKDKRGRGLKVGGHSKDTPNPKMTMDQVVDHINKKYGVGKIKY